ncbi:MAG: hypothetical protein N3E36_02595 [Sulfolobales archaeon]|nr:hypothetical protein [Sulfolobales archaeon]MCX8198904.1 hypothetical protein [Sulfolobales archaeon]MDW8169882.1 archaellin/type IV pilin N-terminal domain-containing protein [Desulfurococcaceae archaeon]
MSSTKAVSPIVATVLLIVIAISTGILLWVWVSGYISRDHTQSTIVLEERIRVEAIQVNSTGDFLNITIYVRNMGSIATVISSAYVLDANGNYITASINISEELEPGKVKGVIVTSSNTSLTSGYMYIAKVVTFRGTEASYLFVAP